MRFRDIAAFVLHCGHTRSFKVIYFDVTEKQISDYILQYNNNGITRSYLRYITISNCDKVMSY